MALSPGERAKRGVAAGGPCAGPSPSLGGIWQPGGRTCRRAARRAGRRVQPRNGALFRPGALPRDPVRSARLREEQPDGRRRRPGRGAGQQHDRAPDRGHQSAARRARHQRQDARLRRQLGQHAGDGLRHCSPGQMREPHPARHLPRRAGGSAFHVPGQCRDLRRGALCADAARRLCQLSRRLGALPRPDRAARPGRCDEGV